VSPPVVVQTIPYKVSDGKALFFGLAIRDDYHVFVSGGGSNVISEYSYNSTSATPLTFVKDLPLNPDTTTSSSYVGGIGFIDGSHLLVTCQFSGEIVNLDTLTGARVGTSINASTPYDVAVDLYRQHAYISQWGGSSVLDLDVSNGLSPTVVGTITGVGKGPEGLVVWPPSPKASQRLIVTSPDSDQISLIDLTTTPHVVVDAIATAPATHPQRGSAPNHVSYSNDSSRAFVAVADENCVDVYDTSTWQRLGRIPVGWYPTATAMVPNGDLYVANGKGIGLGPYKGNGSADTEMRGTISVIPASELTGAALASNTTQVEANEMRPASVGPTVQCPPTDECRYPLPPQPGLPTPIEHVILIVRENKTYDANLGDLGTDASGDPSLVEWGEHITPNLHALARAFTNGDNFYSNAEASIQGHSWVTAGMANDYIEKGWLTGWGRHTRPTTTFADAIGSPERGYYFQHMARAGIDYIDYGEIVGVAGNLMPGDSKLNTDVAWPGGVVFNLITKDVKRAQYFATQLTDYDFLPKFNFVLLPNNHTNGLSAGSWTPEYMVSDNDEGTGRIVDAISKSHYWPTSIIFIIEDDPSDGYDHVEAHRSTLVVVSPWVKRHYTVHTHYDVPSLWRTIELLLGLPPESQQTAEASPMFDIFATEPDYTPYDFLPGTVPEAKNAKSRLGDLSAKLDFSGPDRAPGLGRILWQYLKGTEPPAPPRPEEKWFEEERVRFNVLGGFRPHAPDGKVVPAGDDDDDD
jgi:hypothetical protein